MSLPNPNMDFSVFDTLPATELDDLVENIEALADGSGLNTGDASNGVSNTKLKTGVGEPGGAWNAYTPTPSGVTVGNGVFACTYKQVGKTVFVKFGFTLGTTSSITGTPKFTLPVTPNSSFINSYAGGVLRVVDFGSAGYPAMVLIESPNLMQILGISSLGTYAGEYGVSSTAPFTWTTNDYINGSFFYEAA